MSTDPGYWSPGMEEDVAALERACAAMKAHAGGTIFQPDEAQMLMVPSPPAFRDTVAEELGWTADRFGGWAWLNLAADPPEFIASMVVSWRPGRGHFRSLALALERRCWTLVVPTPLGRMAAIVENPANGFHAEIREADGEHYECWVRRPRQDSPSCIDQARRRGKS